VVHNRSSQNESSSDHKSIHMQSHPLHTRNTPPCYADSRLLHWPSTPASTRETRQLVGVGVITRETTQLVGDRKCDLRAAVQARMRGWCQRSSRGAWAGVWGENTAENSACSFIPGRRSCCQEGWHLWATKARISSCNITPNGTHLAVNCRQGRQLFDETDLGY